MAGGDQDRKGGSIPFVGGNSDSRRGRMEAGHCLNRGFSRISQILGASCRLFQFPSNRKAYLNVASNQ